MTFVEKLKRFFNLGGIELNFEVDTEIAKHKGEIMGKILVTSKGERNVKKIHLTLEQRRDEERNGNSTTKYIKIGSADYETNYSMKAGETKTLDFVLPFDPQKSFTDKVTDTLMNQGGLLSVVGAVGAFAANIEIKYTLKVKAEIEGTMFNPEEAIQVKLL